ncbi:hypothetical protein ACFFJT_16195 [Dyella flava]|uniref:Type VI secretion protein n=1 Tax=Dyella flava TaxID=1920170 RepID=A0ABS2K4F0_9GAMM|nr:hypothetical protein [Dyella flava]MBM7125930.1 hypothetical protein [Dyella flava]GLQ48553.1 hypothetical protein GCM10010872_00020 [Dyella flava]
MAVDFSLLPSEEPAQISAPSRPVWTIAFFLMVLAGVFAVLLFWPKDMPTQTWKFWTSLVLFPIGIPALIVLRRYSIYEGDQLDASLHNEAVRDFNTRVFEAASTPLVLMDAAHRFSAEPDKNTAKAVRDGAVTLTSQDPIAKKGEPVKARWLIVPGMRITAGKAEDDRHRRQQVTVWLFNELLDEVLPRIESLPACMPLTIHLALANGFTHEENLHLWRQCWHARSLRSADVTPPSTTPADLMLLDTWLDQTLEQAQLHATLLVAIQLHPLLSDAPDAGTAEAGTALLLVPESLATQHRLPHIAHLHRPVQSLLDQPGDALSHALQWAGIEGAHIATGWQTGLDVAQAGALIEPSKKIDLAARITDLNQTVGHAGAAAPWLALACAASSLSEEKQQIVLVGQNKHIHCAVMKHVGTDAATQAPANEDSRDRLAAPHLPSPSISQAYM